jgi:hypothetical protein
MAILLPRGLRRSHCEASLGRSGQPYSNGWITSVVEEDDDTCRVVVTAADSLDRVAVYLETH